MEGQWIMLANIILLFLIGYMYMEQRSSDLTYERSKVDGSTYLVRNLPDKNYAADRLATIKRKMMKLRDHLRRNYPNNEAVTRLLQRYNPNNISETENGSKYTSYTLNKGEKMSICLRSRDKGAMGEGLPHKGAMGEGLPHGGNLEGDNILTFVSLHELSHIMSKSVGHDNDEFWRNFKFILKCAVDIGLYNNTDYASSPVRYCGMSVTDSPLNDDSIRI